MYAIVATGGKQYRVQEGDIIQVEKLAAAEGEQVVFPHVLAVSDDKGLQVGNPYLEGATVSAKVLQQGKGKKVVVYKYKPKKNYRRKQGHRQPFTRVKIEKISVST